MDTAHALLRRIQTDRSDHASVIALSGELGAGKTMLVKTLAQVLVLQDEVRSPTFVIEQVYDLPADAPYERLVHIDAYRLESGGELTALGFNELVADPGNLVVVEWAENVREVMPADALWLRIEVVGEEERDIKFVDSSS